MIKLPLNQFCEQLDTIPVDWEEGFIIKPDSTVKVFADGSVSFETDKGESFPRYQTEVRNRILRVYLK